MASSLASVQLPKYKDFVDVCDKRMRIPCCPITATVIPLTSNLVQKSLSAASTP